MKTFFCSLLNFGGVNWTSKNMEIIFVSLFWSSPIFSVETETGNCGLSPFQISGHAPKGGVVESNGSVVSEEG